MKALGNPIKTGFSVRKMLSRFCSALRNDIPIESFDPRIIIMKDSELRNTRRTSLNRICDISDWRTPGEISDIMRSLGEDVYIHRKAWEYAYCIYGLTHLGQMKPDTCAISVGAGYEKPLFYCANRIRKMVATDLYDNWGSAGEGDPGMLTFPEKFAPFPYKKENLDVFRMNGTDLKFPDNSFDFAFTISSIEHFGSRQDIKKAIHEINRVLKPGGILCLVTELILNKGHHPEFFTIDEFKKYCIESPDTGFTLVGGDLDLRISRSLVLNPVDLDSEKDLHVSPHIVLKSRNVIFTSVICFLQKENQYQGNNR